MTDEQKEEPTEQGLPSHLQSGAYKKMYGEHYKLWSKLAKWFSAVSVGTIVTILTITGGYIASLHHTMADMSYDIKTLRNDVDPLKHSLSSEEAAEQRKEISDRLDRMQDDLNRIQSDLSVAQQNLAMIMGAFPNLDYVKQFSKEPPLSKKYKRIVKQQEQQK